MGTHPIFESDFDCLTDLKNCKKMLRIPARRLKQIINRYFIPDTHPKIIPEELQKNAYHCPESMELAVNVPPIDFGQLCVEPIEIQNNVNVGRNKDIVQQWTPIEKNVIGIVNEYSYPAAHGLFC